MSFAWNQLQSAVRALAGTTDRRDRLACAYGKLIKLKPKDLPSEAAETYVRLTGRIARYPLKNINQEIRAEVHSLTDKEVTDAIRHIMLMYDAVAAYQPRPVRHTGRPPRCATSAFEWPITAMSRLGMQVARELAA